MFGPRPEKPLMVVSNRLPISLRRSDDRLEVERSAGGLVSALDPALRRMGGTWIGWPGMRLRNDETLPPLDSGYRISPVHLADIEVRRYYHGLSNRTLWPLFHSFPERTRFDRRDWEVYERVNQRFAELTVEEAQDGQLIWVHDYHLIRVAHFIRRDFPDARIVFFLHIPFPSYDIYRILPWYREILMGLMACDLVGFHSPGYVSNFLDCADRLLGARVDRDARLVEFGARTIRADAFPLGIDFEAQEQRAREAPGGSEQEGQQIILGVDRLDYTKGIPERILAFERLLEVYPEHRERATLVQLAVPSRDQVAEYRALKREIDELVGRVNGRFATSHWSPIRYLYRSLPQDELAGLYRDADVALVTPLRDGMNLVAKEFVASQTGDPGVLVLSRLAGAAEHMHEALRVNPYNIDSVAENLHRALTMDADERADRMRALQLRERRDDLRGWLDGFMEAARAPMVRMRPTTPADFDAWLGRFLARGLRIALFLDYDGTLTPIVSHPKDATLAEPVRDLLRRCAARSDMDVTIVSGRAMGDVRKQVGLDSLSYAGNHGLEISGPDLVPFDHQDVPHYQRRILALAETLRNLCPDGAWVEEKGASLTLHLRGVAPLDRAAIEKQAREHITEAGFQVREAHRALEARPPIGWDKGHAVLYVLRERYGPAWSERVRVLYAGDDRTDEDAFRALSGLGITFRIGSADAPTLATRPLPDVAAVHTLLEWLVARPDRPAKPEA